MPSAVVSRRGVDRIRAGHPWIFRTDVVDVWSSDKLGDIAARVADTIRELRKGD